jgi:biotin carboxyl carrier protein
LKLELEIDGQVMDAEFDSVNGTARLVHGGKNYEASVSLPEPGIFVIVFNHRVYRCVVEKLPDGRTEIVINGRRIPVAVRDKKRFRAGSGLVADGDGLMALSSPMPGKVVRVLLNVGDEVASHQGVLVVEAMKMQNEVQSPKAGRVAEIRVSEGQTVNAGEVLAVIE